MGFLCKFLDVSETLEGRIKEQLSSGFLAFAPTHKTCVLSMQKGVKNLSEHRVFFAYLNIL